jgi:HpcH/HpaI aldolase/citrate lyase family
MMAPTTPFQLWLFSTDAVVVDHALAAGIDGLVVDWERRGKDRRQASADTQIGTDTADDLRRLRATTAAPILCRINGVSETTAEEVNLAIDGGASEILVPMVRSPVEIDVVLELAAGRCGVGILIETTSAVEQASVLLSRPLSRVYVGLNDLAIERGAASIFEAVTDGTVERIRRMCPVPFGFGGLTLPDRGRPVPCHLLMGEMARLACQFSFLRRSFLRDVPTTSLEDGVRRIRAGLDHASHRVPGVIDQDRRALQDRVTRGEGDIVRGALR